MKNFQNQGSKSSTETKETAAKARIRRQFRQGYSSGLCGTRVRAYHTDAFWNGYFAGQNCRFLQMEREYFASQRYYKEVSE